MSKFFIRRPIVAIVIAILTVIIGAVSLATLPTAQYPDIVPPEIMVQSTYPGADAKTLEQAVSTPIEQQMNGVDNMLYMYSVNANNGQSTVYVDFDVKTNPDIDQVLSQLRVSQIQGEIPSVVTQAGITVQKSLTSPLMLVNLSAPDNRYSADFLTNYAIINLQDELTRVPGVSRIQVFGGQYALRVWVKPDQLAKLGVTATDVINALQTQNNVYPAGQIGGEPVPNGQQFTYTVRTQGRLVTPEEFGNIVIRANADGSVLHLRDVARVELGTQVYNLTARYNKAPSGVLAVYQLPGANAVQTAIGVRKKLAELSTTFPAGMRYDVPLDTTLAVTAGIHEIVITLFLALGLVILVVFVFLQGWRATLIPLMAVPVSLIGTFIIFPFLGFSINTLSLFGLVLAIGLVVDDAIIVVEAVEHHIDEGMTPKDASIKAMEEVGGPVVAIALILAAVFIPTAAIPGITGRLYQQFAITIAISVLISAFNALTLSPALSALLLKPKDKERKPGPLKHFFDWFNRFFGRTTDRFVHTSGVLIHKSGFAMLALAIIAVVAVFMGGKLPSGFIPQEDQGYLFVMTQLPDASSLQRTDATGLQVSDALLSTPGIAGVVQVNGFSLLTQTQSTNAGFFFVSLKPWDTRKSKEEQLATIQATIQRKLMGIGSGLAFSFPPPAIPGIGTSGGVTMILQDRSGNDDPMFLTKNLYAFLGAVSKRPEIAAAMPSYLPAVPQLYADVDREKAMEQQVDLGNIYTTMQTFMGGYLVNYFNRFGRQWQTYVEAEGNTRTNIDNIGQFYVPSANGSQVPLSALVHVKKITGPEFILRFNEYEAAQLNITGAPGYSSGQVRAALEEVFKQTMPPGMGYAYQGMSFQEQQAAQGVPAWAVFGLSLLFVFLILAALYESWTLPFSVLLSTPVAILGAYLALTMRSFENDIFATIGLVMLIGLSAKNAILIVEFAVVKYRAGQSIAQSALEAARLRFRPIVMTAFAFIFGCLPLWTATGSGAGSRRILGTVVIGGMTIATIFGIVMIPVTFAVVEFLSHRFSKHGGKNTTMDSTHPPEFPHGDPSNGPKVEGGHA
ncbi:efflux RND transporter permease subunit [Silvibacterium dinghuense]|uniref:Multidrug efflux RND transporter permease subunit n=1 Tax=Silvibacterium dinghuense TaxID=1560006 RepID=A0A4Q1SH21_9BACT|nr:multidrug efflux RND transporter permease subunit [Silvibacterium dinghuense]RXS96826.1 multidrug efflux RND transporter permease subunit [Silvibacterium dinghuense]GGG93962.1 multidrug efflux RND transporter permease subunit [Silvibacterium dinghuense]